MSSLFTMNLTVNNRQLYRAFLSAIRGLNHVTIQVTIHIDQSVHVEQIGNHNQSTITN